MIRRYAWISIIGVPIKKCDYEYRMFISTLNLENSNPLFSRQLLFVLESEELSTTMENIIAQRRDYIYRTTPINRVKPNWLMLGQRTLGKSTLHRKRTTETSKDSNIQLGQRSNRTENSIHISVTNLFHIPLYELVLEGNSKNPELFIFEHEKLFPRTQLNIIFLNR